MNKKTIAVLIAVALVIFVSVKVLASQLCLSMQGNANQNVMTSAASSVFSSASPSKTSPVAEPLSWDPVLRQLAIFFSKVCGD